jgi:myo-inositol 2-dehydrogenase / D-chiro-inositol 1-dehydrogenase
MGRMATYSGRVVSWEQATESKRSLFPKRLDFDATPPTKRDKDGKCPVAIPGISQAF